MRVFEVWGFRLPTTSNHLISALVVASSPDGARGALIEQFNGWDDDFLGLIADDMNLDPWAWTVVRDDGATSPAPDCLLWFRQRNLNIEFLPVATASARLTTDPAWPMLSVVGEFGHLGKSANR